MTAAATRAGMIMGTAAYMSPEQARGAAVDKRADIWAFGCVILEMITGKGTFKENTVSDTLASVLKTDPDWAALPSDAPRALQRLLRRCLQKEPQKRLRDIGEARIQIDEILSGSWEEEAAFEPAAGTPTSRGRWFWIVLTAMVMIMAITVVLTLILRPAASESTVQKFEIVRGELQIDDPYASALSPDGRRIVYATDDSLWIRELEQLEARRLPGTEGAQHPLWSPDNDFVGYAKDGGLWKIPVQGGPSSAIATAVGEFGGGAGASWGSDGRIIYSRGSTGLFEVSALPFR